MEIQYINAVRPPVPPATDGTKPSAADEAKVQAQKAQTQHNVADDTQTTHVQQKPPAEQVSESQRENMVEQFKTAIESLASVNLKFTIDKDTDRTVVKVVDKETGKTIRQIPSEEILALDKALTRIQGLLFHDKA